MLMLQSVNRLAVACSGLLPSLIGVCHVAVQFPLYEYCKAKIAERENTTVDRLDPLSVVSSLLLACVGTLLVQVLHHLAADDTWGFWCHTHSEHLIEFLSTEFSHGQCLSAWPVTQRTSLSYGLRLRQHPSSGRVHLLACACLHCAACMSQQWKTP